MHLFTTPKKKLQRRNTNKVWNQKQLGTLFKFWTEFEFTADAILKILTKCNQNNSSNQSSLLPASLSITEHKPIQKFQNFKF
jgi:hypothetical protein